MEKKPIYKSKNEIDSILLRKILKEEGFRLKGDSLVLEHQDGYCKETTETCVREFLEDYVEDDEDQLGKIISNKGNWKGLLKDTLRNTKLPLRKVIEDTDDDLFVYNKQGNCSIESSVLVDKLTELGYRSIMEDSRGKHYTLCLDTDNSIQRTTPDRLRDDALSMCMNRKERSAVYNHNKIATLGFANNLRTVHFVPYKDTEDTCALFFQNGVYVVNRKGENQLISNKDFDYRGRKIWGENNIERSIDTSMVKNYKDGEFYKFCTRVIGGEDGIDYLMRAIGYLVHSYKDMGQAYAIVLSESDNINNNIANGGTGKSLIAKALKNIRGESYVDGKKYKADNDFALQNVDSRSDVVLIDDVLQNFRYNSLYNAITGDMSVELKGLTPEITDFSLSPKFVITSNYGIVSNGSSDIRRRRIIGVSNYYNADRTPKSEFGHNFFSDWKGKHEDEWQYFYGFMIACVEKFFEYGNVENYNSEGIENRAWDNIYGERLRDYCLSNYINYLGVNHAKTIDEWEEEVKEVVYRQHRDTWQKVFESSMSKYGFVKQSHKERVAGKYVRKFYFELENVNELNRILTQYGYDNYDLYGEDPEPEKTEDLPF